MTSPTSGCCQPLSRCRVLKPDALAVSFYGWNKVDVFMAAWKQGRLSGCGAPGIHQVLCVQAAFVGYRHECAYLLAKGRPQVPGQPLPDVLPWAYSGNRHHRPKSP